MPLGNALALLIGGKEIVGFNPASRTSFCPWNSLITIRLSYHKKVLSIKWASFAYLKSFKLCQSLKMKRMQRIGQIDFLAQMTEYVTFKRTN